VLTIKELRALVSRMSEEQVVRELGPFTLIQRPTGKDRAAVLGQAAPPLHAQQTSVMRPADLEAGFLALLFQFDDLIVATLPPVKGATTLSVGRLPDSDLVLDHPSVSKRHAALHWDEQTALCSVQDLGSTNGTFLNAAVRIHRQMTLRDGDIVSFGEVHFWYLATPTLYERLRNPSGVNRLGSHSG
jgi:pSer/pThr/pTyr-binding forkhead associated (FHA) protein